MYIQRHAPALFEFVRYTGIVLIGLCIDVGLLYALTTYTEMWYLLAAGISFTIALITNYILATRYAFENRPILDRRKEFITFFSIGVSALCINQVVMYIAVDLFSHAVLIGKCIAIPLTFIWNFGLNKALLFHNRIS